MVNMIVCAKQVLDPEMPPAAFKIDTEAKKAIQPKDVKQVVSPFDENAVEAALKIKDAQKGSKIRVISMGTKLEAEVVKKPLTVGADELFLLEDDAFERCNSYTTAQVLAAAIKKMGEYDIIFCGRQAADWDAGQVGSGIAEILGIPTVTLAQKVEVADGKLRVERVTSDGYEVVEVPMPALITVSNELGEMRYAKLKGIMKAKKKPVTTWKSQDLGVDLSKRRTKLLKLFVPVRETKCQIIEGETVEEMGVNLALKLREAKLI
jgi:electron transfer flavoprotein beta subunit